MKTISFLFAIATAIFVSSCETTEPTQTTTTVTEETSYQQPAATNTVETQTYRSY